MDPVNRPLQCGKAINQPANLCPQLTMLPLLLMQFR